MEQKEHGIATDAQIKSWKEEHGDVFALQQEDTTGDIHYTYFRNPTLTDKQYAMNVADGYEFGVALTNEVRLGGSEAVMENFQLKEGFMAEVLKRAKPIKGIIAKL